MKKIAKKDERRRSTVARKNSSSKQPTAQPSSSAHGTAPRRLKNKLYICGLLPTVLREELIREFGRFGKLHDVWVAKKPPGFAFVEYINSRDAERVVHELDDTKVLGSKVRIEFAKANKGPEDVKKPKKVLPLGRAGSSSGKLGSSKPAVAPLMGRLIVPSLLTASLAPSLSLLGSPPLSGLSLPPQGMMGPTFKRTRSPRDGKRCRGDSGGRWEHGLGRKAVSPLMRRISRSPKGRGSLSARMMLSPPPKRSTVPSPPFSRLSRSQRSIPSLLPPPPSRDLDVSPSKLMRMPGAALRRFSRSPIGTGSLGRTRRSLSRTRVRSPRRSWARASPEGPKRSGVGRPQQSTSPPRNRSPVVRRQRSVGRGRERSASLRRNFVKSQVNPVRRDKKTLRSRSVASGSCDVGKNAPRASLSREERGSRAAFKGVSRGVVASPERQKKRHDARNRCGYSKSASKSPGGRRQEGKRSRSQSSSDKSIPNLDYERDTKTQQPQREVVSFDRRSSRSSDRRNSMSLRRHFYRSPERCYSRDRSPPLNFVRTRLLGRTPPSPPVRNSKTPDKRDNNMEDGQKSASNSPDRSENGRISRSRSYESRRSAVRSSHRRGSAKSGRESFNSSARDRPAAHVGRAMSRSTSRTSSESTPSPRVARRNKNYNSTLKSPEGNVNSVAPERSRHGRLNPKSLPAAEAVQNRAGQRKRSRSRDSVGTAPKRPCVRPKGGPRSPSGSPDLNSTKFHARIQLPTEGSRQKRSSSSKSKNSNFHSEKSRNASTGRKTPLAYQCPRESVSPPARKKEFRNSKSQGRRTPKSPGRASPRSRTKAKPSRRNRETQRARAATPPDDTERYRKESRRSPYPERHRVRYYKSPPPPAPPLPPPLSLDHRHYRMMEDDMMAMRMERSRAVVAAAYYDDRHHVDSSRAHGYYRRPDYPAEPEKGYYRRPSPPSHLPPPPLPAYPYRRMPEAQYQRSGTRVRCEEVDRFYRTSDPYGGRIPNPSSAVYRTGANAPPPPSAATYPRQRSYRR